MDDRGRRPAQVPQAVFSAGREADAPAVACSCRRDAGDGLSGHALFAAVSWGFGAADAACRDAALTGAGVAH